MNHDENCKYVTSKLLTGTERDCDCGVAYDDVIAENDELREAIRFFLEIAGNTQRCFSSLAVRVLPGTEPGRGIALSGYSIGRRDFLDAVKLMRQATGEAPTPRHA